MYFVFRVKVLGLGFISDVLMFRVEVFRVRVYLGCCSV